MMKISIPFNRLYHALIKEFHSMDYVVIDMNGTDFKLRPRGLSYNSFKQLQKHLNLDYPRVEGVPISTCNIDNKQLVLHVEWLINTVYLNGGKISHIEAEFKRICNEYER